MPESVRLKIKRQNRPLQAPYWEEFEVPTKPAMNVISCLVEIAREPRTFDGRKTTPVAWESSCLEEVCGACTMVINGRVRQACSTLVQNIAQPVVIEPMQKFPVVRDLVVDRSSMFRNLRRVHAWIPAEGRFEGPAGPEHSPELARERYEMSRCMMCGCCLDACPQVGPHSEFAGAAILNQIELMNSHPSGKDDADNRLEALMTKGGAADCGNAQNCVRVCPKNIPLTASIAKINRELTVKMFKDLFS
ncbi:MAG: succinate dehydrogenase iron-sulfur subunit [Candidatus Omnitrophica bacterium]|nr:succinate dehydrogenase iron-sulfur subunit [Candidatus Omnitrophota bacterium]